MHPHAGLDACAAQAPGEPRGVDDRRAAVHPHAAVVRGGCHLLAHRCRVEHIDGLTVVAHRAGDLDELVVLPGRGRDVEHAGALEGAVDVVHADRRLDGVEVLEPHAVERVELIRETAETVGEPVREAGIAEAAVASGGCCGGASGLEDHDVERGSALLGEQRRPEPGETGADDREVAFCVALQWRSGLWCHRIVEPEHPGHRIAQSGVLRGRGHARHLPRAMRGRAQRRASPAVRGVVRLVDNRIRPRGNGGCTVDWKLEQIIVPVSDIDRAKTFYMERAGFGLDVDYQAGEDFRVVQLTPHGSACSIALTKNAGSAGTVQGLHLVVTDIEAASSELRERGIEVSDVFHFEDGNQVTELDPGRSDYNSFFTFSDPDGNGWMVQEVGRISAEG